MAPDGQPPSSRPDPARPDHQHRDVRGGRERAAVFGVSDGLVSNVLLVIGFAGAAPDTDFVWIAGLLGLVSGATSMAAGEYVSMRAQTELLERELELERIELARHPKLEQVELADLYRSRGMASEQADALAEHVMADPELALETHAREELGIAPDALGSPVGAAVSSFLAFTLGALVPLLPWAFARGTAAVLVSVVASAVAALAVGAALARLTHRPVVRGAMRQLAFAALPATVTYLIGRAVGTAV